LDSDCAMVTYALAQRAQLMVAEMEAVGMPLDHAGLAALASHWRTELVDVDADARRLISLATGRAVHSLNLKSSQQVAQVVACQLPAEEMELWPRTPHGALRTDSATLARSSLPFARQVVRCRELHHALSHYAPYCSAAAAGGGRLYPIYHLSGAVTGRMSCSNPNLHSMPRQPEFRSLVAASRGGVLVKGDFSQVELRVLAEVSGDVRMRQAFSAGEDLHRLTAAALLGTPQAEVTAEQRQLAKAVNFGLIYGQSAAGLQQYAQASYSVELSLEEAHVARRRFFETYPGVAAWQKEQRERAGRGDSLLTPSGRRAHHLRAAWSEAAACTGTGAKCLGVGSLLRRLEREALNFPIQGGAAEVMLACLGWLQLSLEPLQAHCRLICVVHDEFLLDCIDAAATDAAAAALHGAMLKAWLQVFPAATPLDGRGAVIAIGPNWSELAPWPGSS